MTSRRTIRLFNALIRECACGRRLWHFSSYLRYRLEQFERKVRKEIVNRTVNDDNWTPLFIACETENAKMVEYLISICDADVEQTCRGFREDFIERTPLQRVCYIVKNCFFGDSSTNFHPKKITDVVECLVKYGADINRVDALGGTCLMDTVRTVELCEILLKNGADVDARDRRNKTALHHAIEGKLLDTVKLLLDYGADVTLRSLDNDDALQTACIAGFRPIFDYLVEHGSYSPGRLADANELIGSRCFRDRQTALEYWHKAMEIRDSNTVDGNPLAKTPSMPKRDYYRNASEFTTLDELDAIALDSDALGIQSLLMHERILGEHHRATFDALKRTGASYTEPFRYQYCFDFWRRALEISVVNDSISWGDVAEVGHGLLRAMVHSHKRTLELEDRNHVNTEQSRFADVVVIFKLLTSRLVTAQPPPKEELLASYSEKVNSYDAILRCIVYVIHFFVKTAQTTEAEGEVRALVRHLMVNQNPMTARNHDTLLHLCVSRYSSRDFDELFFPDLEVTKLLLECEADVNARNKAGRTPLHVITSFHVNFCEQHAKLLLDHGAHLDTLDEWGRTPAHGISKRCNTVDLINYMTLRCLAAQAIVKNKIQYHNLPPSVNQFLDLHRPL